MLISLYLIEKLINIVTSNGNYSHIIYNANVVGRKQCTCIHGCHINGLINSVIDQDDEHINVAADDTGRAYIRISLVLMQSAVRQRENMCQQ